MEIQSTFPPCNSIRAVTSLWVLAVIFSMALVSALITLLSGYEITDLEFRRLIELEVWVRP